jgi:DNA-binding XRE family transcriptional regulator
MDVNDPLAAALGIDLGNAEERRGAELAYEDQHWLASLVRVRRASTLTQKEIAERMQTSQEAVSRLEKLGNDPRLSTIRRYALAVGIGYRHELVDVPAAEAQPTRMNVTWLPYGQVTTSGTPTGFNSTPSLTNNSHVLVKVG